MTRIGITIDRPDDASAQRSGTAAPWARALSELGEVSLLQAGSALPAALQANRPDVVFNSAREPQPPGQRHHVAAILEMFGVPFSGSGSATLALTSSRARVKEALGARQVATAVYTIVHDPVQLAPLARRSFPLALFRPTEVYSADGALVVDDADQLEREARAIWSVGPTSLLVERHLTGDAFACVVLGNGADRAVLPPVSLAIGAGAVPQVGHVPDGLLQGMERVALEACLALDLRDCARVDVALSDTGVPHVVAVDPLPDFTGGFANPVLLAADAAGMDDMELIQRTLVLAAERFGLTMPNAPRFDEVRRRTPPRGLRMRARHA